MQSEPSRGSSASLNTSNDLARMITHVATIASDYTVHNTAIGVQRCEEPAPAREADGEDLAEVQGHELRGDEPHHLPDTIGNNNRASSCADTRGYAAERERRSEKVWRTRRTARNGGRAYLRILSAI